MDEQSTKKRGRPRLTAEEKAERARMRRTGELPTVRRSDKVKFGQEYVEPGDNSKYLRHALSTLNMPPVDIADPKQVEDRIFWYFEHCGANDMKPTVAGLCNSLGISRNTLRTWYNEEFRATTHAPIVKRAYALLEELWEDYMLNGKINPVSGIFIGKNSWNYADKQEVVLTPNHNQIDPTDIKTIEQKYAELPEEF